MSAKTLIGSLAGLALASLVSCSQHTTTQGQGKYRTRQVGAKTSTAVQQPLKTYHGIASWYSIKTNYGRTTASGRPLSNEAKTAAHKSLPFGTRVRITCLDNGKSEVVQITDRGPYTKGRIIDVTKGCAQRLGFVDRGITKVKVEVLSWGDWKYGKS